MSATVKNSKMARRYGEEFKRQAVELLLNSGKTHRPVARELGAISAHESGRWKSRIARKKNNWMGLMARKGPKSFGTPKESIFYAAKLLNRKPFKGRNTLSQVAPIYCANRPGDWEACVLQWEHELREWQSAETDKRITVPDGIDLSN